MILINLLHVWWLDGLASLACTAPIKLSILIPAWHGGQSQGTQGVKSPALFRRLTAWHACRGTPDPRDESLAAHLMRVRDPNGRLLPHARQWSELSIFFYAGMETTAHTIAW